MFFVHLWSWFYSLVCLKPHFIVYSDEGPYLLRWHLIPKNRWLNVYLHKFLRDDDDRALHDHPWNSLSFVIKGSYWDHTKEGVRKITAPSIIYRTALDAHRVELMGQPAWTIFVTGPKKRDWGFLCPKGWRHWREFANPKDKGRIGRGCD